MLTKILGYTGFGFLGGVLIHSLVSSGAPWFVSIIVTFILSVLGYLVSLRWSWVMYVSLFLFGCGLGLLRFTASIDTYQSHILDEFVHQEESLAIVGTIIREPLVFGAQRRFVIRSEYIHGRDIDIPVQTTILVRSYQVNEYEYGQRVMIEGVIQKPSVFQTDTGRDFDYQSYLGKDNIFYTTRAETVRILETGPPGFKRGLYQIKHHFLDAIYQRIPKPESGLLAGILFGQDGALDKETEDNFRRTGLMHIVVLSGYNISLVIIALMAVLSFLPLRIRSVFIVFGIVSFALLVGAGPTVVRASIMALFIVLGRLVGMRYDVLRALLIAGVIMVIINPKILVFDISFQLSFLASYGLIYGARILEPYFAWLPNTLLIRESALTTISAQIFVSPLILYAIGEFSLVAPIVNILVLFAVPITMLFGFVTSLFQIIVPTLATLFVYPTTYLLKYQLSIVELFARIPFATIRIPSFSFVWVIVMYGIIIGWFRYLENKQQSRKNMLG